MHTCQFSGLSSVSASQEAILLFCVQLDSTVQVCHDGDRENGCIPRACFVSFNLLSPSIDMFIGLSGNLNATAMVPGSRKKDLGC